MKNEKWLGRIPFAVYLNQKNWYDKGVGSADPTPPLRLAIMTYYLFGGYRLKGGHCCRDETPARVYRGVMHFNRIKNVFFFLLPACILISDYFLKNPDLPDKLSIS